MRRTVIAVALVSAAAMAGVTLAQYSARSNSGAAQAYIQAMQTMDDKMKAMAPNGDPDKDFVMMMKPHHPSTWRKPI